MLDFVVANDSGGVIIEYVIRARKVEQRGLRVKIAGRCDSACTLYLTVPNACVTKRASFGFHLPYGASKHSNTVAAKYMLDSYPKWVRAWLNSKGGLTKSIKRMNYTYASRFLKTC